MPCLDPLPDRLVTHVHRLFPCTGGDEHRARLSRIIPEFPRRSHWPVELEEVDQTRIIAASDRLFGDVVSPFPDAGCNPGHGHIGTRQPEEDEVELIAGED